MTAIQRQERDHPVKWMCSQLGVKRSTFYAWRGRKGQKSVDRDAFLTLHIKAAHQASDGTYGSPRVHRELRAQGIHTSRKRVERIMRENAIAGATSRKFVKTTIADSEAAPAPNLLGRNFAADGPNQKWVTDITYIPTREGWLYLAIVVDLYSNRIVGSASADHMRTELPLDALKQALCTRTPQRRLLHHSDRGCQYTSAAYQRVLRERGIVCSMSRTAECWDNAPAESVFGRLKEELIYRRVWNTRSAAAAAIDRYIRCFWNPKRRQRRLGYLSPIDFELQQRQRLAA